MEKISVLLIDQLKGRDPGEMVDVVLEIAGRTPEDLVRQGRKALRPMQQEFANVAAPVTEEVQRLGGEVLELTWLARALKARVPASAVAGLAQSDGIARIELPKEIRRG